MSSLTARRRLLDRRALLRLSETAFFALDPGTRIWRPLGCYWRSGLPLDDFVDWWPGDTRRSRAVWSGLATGNQLFFRCRRPEISRRSTDLRQSAARSGRLCSPLADQAAHACLELLRCSRLPTLRPGSSGAPRAIEPLQLPLLCSAVQRCQLARSCAVLLPARPVARRNRSESPSLVDWAWEPMASPRCPLVSGSGASVPNARGRPAGSWPARPQERPPSDQASRCDLIPALVALQPSI